MLKGGKSGKPATQNIGCNPIFRAGEPDFPFDAAQVFFRQRCVSFFQVCIDGVRLFKAGAGPKGKLILAQEIPTCQREVVRHFGGQTVDSLEIASGRHGKVGIRERNVGFVLFLIVLAE